jgi:hypothetical protein
MLSIVYVECRKQTQYAQCHYAECHYAECRGTNTITQLSFGEQTIGQLKGC